MVLFGSLAATGLPDRTFSLEEALAGPVVGSESDMTLVYQKDAIAGNAIETMAKSQARATRML